MQHQPGRNVSRGRVPEWLEKARAQARRSSENLPGGVIDDVREETTKGQISAIMVEARLDLNFPAALKARGVQKVFVKMNTRHLIENEGIVKSVAAGRSLVVVYEGGKITGLPVTKAQAKKLVKTGFSHFTISYDPDQSREEHNKHLGPEGLYYEEGFWIRWYTPKGGHKRDGDKGGEVVAEFQDELFVLQFLFENGLEALYEIDLLVDHGFLPVSDDRRYEEEVASFNGGVAPGGKIIRNARIHPAQSYHGRRLFQRFCDLHREGASDENELNAKARSLLLETVIGKPKHRPSV